MLYDLARVYFWPAGLTGAWTSLTGMGPETPAICPDTPRIRSDNPDLGFRVSSSHDRSDQY